MRYKEFNANRVLEKCIKLFWNKGYGGSSIKEIVEATGVNRFSLYNEFENKEGILYASLNLYLERYAGIFFSAPLKGNSLDEDLFSFFEHYISDNALHPPGCYIIHIATELADTDDTVKTVLKNYCETLEKNFGRILTYHTGEQAETNFYARHLTAFFCSAMCHCVIQTYEERAAHVQNGIKVVLHKKQNYATHA